MQQQYNSLVEVENLQVEFDIKRGVLFEQRVGSVKAVDDVSFAINSGETLGLVGESGSGKTTTGMALMGLVRPKGGSIRFAGREISRLGRAARRSVNHEMQMIFQDPYASLNPRMTIGRIICDPLRVKTSISEQQQVARVAELLNSVGLSPELANQFPHQLSGGQRQRVGIARALALEPRFIICDEPVSALDVSIQAQTLNILRRLQEELSLTYLFISHDLAVVRYISTQIAVMYLGRIVELAPSAKLYAAPQHPYTQALLSAAHSTNPYIERQRRRMVLRGDPPNPASPPKGCHFSTRCPFVTSLCHEIAPPLRQVAPGHWASCHLVVPENIPVMPGGGPPAPSSVEEHTSNSS